MDWRDYKGPAFRYVERQSLIATSELVDTPADQLRLEELLEESKPPIGDAEQLHWLLRSPFRYPPLPYGSRFGREHERGIFYASETLQALEAEAAFYCFKFYQDIAAPPPTPIRRDLSVMRVNVSTQRLVDITSHADADRLIDPQSWAYSQTFGTSVRDAGAEAIRYPSARLPRPEAKQHCNLAIFSPKALSSQGEPALQDSYATLTDHTGVRLQGFLDQTRFFDADELLPRPWSDGPSLGVVP